MATIWQFHSSFPFFTRNACSYEGVWWSLQQDKSFWSFPFWVSNAYGAFCQVNHHHHHHPFLLIENVTINRSPPSTSVFYFHLILRPCLKSQMSSLLFTVLHKVSLSCPLQHLPSGAHVNTLYKYFTKEHLSCFCDQYLICRGRILRHVAYIQSSPKHLFWSDACTCYVPRYYGIVNRTNINSNMQVKQANGCHILTSCSNINNSIK